MYRWNVSNNYGELSETAETAEKITYLEEYPDGEYHGADSNNAYWNK
jgi:hypothetical protein